MSATPMTWVPKVWRRSWKRRGRRGGAVERRAVALGERGAVDVAADDAAEDEVVLVGEVLALAQPCECLRDPRRHRDGADLARLRRRKVAVRVARADADRRAGEVDVSPAQRVPLALAETREGGGEVERGVLLGVGGAHLRHDLLGREDVDLGTQGGAGLLDVGDRIGRQAVELARPLHDAVEDRDRLLARAIGEPAVEIDLDRRPPLDALGGEVLERDVAEVRQDVVAEDRAVVASVDGFRWRCCSM
jgi:hypothetical protein